MKQIDPLPKGVTDPLFSFYIRVGLWHFSSKGVFKEVSDKRRVWKRYTKQIWPKPKPKNYERKRNQNTNSQGKPRGAQRGVTKSG